MATSKQKERRDDHIVLIEKEFRFKAVMGKGVILYW